MKDSGEEADSAGFGLLAPHESGPKEGISAEPDDQFFFHGPGLIVSCGDAESRTTIEFT
jgi:hypothetical protein